MIFVQGFNACCALGSNISQIMTNLSCGQSPGMKPTLGMLDNNSTLFLGHADVEDSKLPAITTPQFNSRNNRLFLYTWQPLEGLYHKLCQELNISPDRVAVIMGTSTSGGAEIDAKVRALYQAKAAEESSGQNKEASAVEQAVEKADEKEVEPPANAANFHFAQQELGNLSTFMREHLGLQASPFSYTISTACSSTLRAIISGVRLLESHMCDIAIVGGADTLNRAVVNGFNSLSLVSQNSICCPFGAERNGITIGEAAGVMVLTRERLKSNIAIVGFGESSDAHHMSAPHPEGAGACLAIQTALSMAHISASDIGYINLHGTGTKKNDEVEAKVIHEIFGEHTPCSSTKYLTGHTLGACGILETVLLCQLLQNVACVNAANQPLSLAQAKNDSCHSCQSIYLPKQDFKDQKVDPLLPPIHLCTGQEQLKTPYVMNNAFAFGGSNASIVLKSFDIF